MESLDELFDRQRQKEKYDKLAQWQEIQQRAPALAAFLLALSARFGKVKLNWVKYHGR